MRKRIIFMTVGLCLALFGICAFGAEEVKAIKLPAPKTKGGKPLMQVLKERHSSRQFSQKELSLQTLSNLLWAGFGINRPDGKRTAPSARNSQEMDIYVAKADGLFRYNAKENSLELIVAKDIRGLTGKQDFVKTAPVNLIYVADLTKTGNINPKVQIWMSMDAGFIAENVYLFCTSEGLATVARGMFDEEELKAEMKLNANQKLILTQSVGYPQ